MKKIYYNLYLVTDNEKIFLAKIKSKGLEIRKKMLYNKVYENQGKIIME